MHPSANETICVTADTCGSRSIARFSERKMTVCLFLHHIWLNGGEQRPMKAKMKLDAPIGSAEEKNQDAVAHRYATSIFPAPCLAR